MKCNHVAVALIKCLSEQTVGEKVTCFGRYAQYGKRVFAWY